jgi:hypothetical protein
VKLPVYLALLSLAACSGEERQVSFICTEPLEKYLTQARQNISNDYEVERSHRLLQLCPDKGFHRRYTFSFDPSSIVSKGASDASVSASWCVNAGERHADAKLTQSTSMLTFAFTYPWSTETGKYPRTEFRLNRFRLTGGFSEELDWECEMVPADAEVQASPPRS